MQARDLNGTDRATHPFVRAQIGDQALQTSVQWQATSPYWEEALSFRLAIVQNHHPHIVSQHQHLPLLVMWSAPV